MGQDIDGKEITLCVNDESAVDSTFMLQVVVDGAVQNELEILFRHLAAWTGPKNAACQASGHSPKANFHLLLAMKCGQASRNQKVISFEFADHVFLNCNGKLLPNSNYDRYLEKLWQVDMEKRFMDLDEQEQRDRLNGHMDPGLELEYTIDMDDETADSSGENAGIPESFATGEAGTAEPPVMGNAEQKEEVKRAMAVRVPKEVILLYFYPETSVVRMMEICRKYE